MPTVADRCPFQIPFSVAIVLEFAKFLPVSICWMMLFFSWQTPSGWPLDKIFSRILRQTSREMVVRGTQKWKREKVYERRNLLLFWISTSRNVLEGSRQSYIPTDPNDNKIPWGEKFTKRTTNQEMKKTTSGMETGEEAIISKQLSNRWIGIRNGHLKGGQ